eukprot:gene5516-6870_t
MQQQQKDRQGRIADLNVLLSDRVDNEITDQKKTKLLEIAKSWTIHDFEQYQSELVNSLHKCVDQKQTFEVNVYAWRCTQALFSKHGDIRQLYVICLPDFLMEFVPFIKRSINEIDRDLLQTNSGDSDKKLTRSRAYLSLIDKILDIVFKVAIPYLSTNSSSGSKHQQQTVNTISPFITIQTQLVQQSKQWKSFKDRLIQSNFSDCSDKLDELSKKFESIFNSLCEYATKSDRLFTENLNSDYNQLSIAKNLIERHDRIKSIVNFQSTLEATREPMLINLKECLSIARDSNKFGGGGGANTGFSSTMNTQAGGSDSTETRYLNNHSRNLASPQIKTILSLCSTLSQIPTAKPIICKLLTSLSHKYNNNEYPLKSIDQTFLINNLKNIFSNLLISPVNSILFLQIGMTFYNFKKNYELNSILISNLIDIITIKEDRTRIEDFLSKIPYRIETLPISDNERYRDHKESIENYDRIKRTNNLTNRHLLLSYQSATCTPPPPPQHQSHQQQNGMKSQLDLLNTSKNYYSKLNNNGNNHYYDDGTFRKEELFVGLDLIKQGFEKIDRQRDIGIKMDKESMDKFKTQYKSYYSSLEQMYDYL